MSSAVHRWFRDSFPKEVAEYFIEQDQEGMPYSDCSGDWTYCVVGIPNSEREFDSEVEKMCCGIHIHELPGEIDGKPVTYRVAWSYGH